MGIFKIFEDGIELIGGPASDSLQYLLSRNHSEHSLVVRFVPDKYQTVLTACELGGQVILFDNRESEGVFYMPVFFLDSQSLHTAIERLDANIVITQWFHTIRYMAVMT